jgi:hypothetical protein
MNYLEVFEKLHEVINEETEYINIINIISLISSAFN